jgi:hypothetical protein
VLRSAEAIMGHALYDEDIVVLTLTGRLRTPQGPRPGSGSRAARQPRKICVLEQPIEPG